MKEKKGVRPKIRFDGQVAIVTGAGTGLGRVYALELARRGAKVLVNDLGTAKDGSGGGSRTPANQVVKEILAFDGEAVANYDSVAIVEGGRAIVDGAIEAFGRVDILVNNAGFLQDRSLVKMEPGNWDEVMDVHLRGAYNVTRPAFIKMRENRYGRIVFTTSAAALYGNFGQTNYSAAKMGLVGFMNTLKLEGGKHIKVNTVAPIAASRLTQGILAPNLFEKCKPELVAPLVLYLCSSQCEDTGMIFNAGMGYFSRAAIATGPGTHIGDGKRVPTVEEIHRHWNLIKRLPDTREFSNASSAIRAMVEAFDQKKGDTL